jgi:hypothetical protein
MATMRSIKSATINLGGPEPVACDVLEDHTRVVTAAQIQGILGVTENRHLARSVARLSKVSGGLTLRPIAFVRDGTECVGYTADDVVAILRAYQRAFLSGALRKNQEPIAMAAMAAIEAFAAVGLRAMIDEATGFLHSPDRPVNDAQGYFERVFRERRMAWEEMFDAEWDRMLCKLYGYEYTGRPPVFVRGLNAMVYRFAFGVDAHDELKRRNPNPQHHSNHHQELTDEARIVLSQTISNVKMTIRLSRGPADFMRKLGVLYKDAPLQLELGAA